ncbi:MAG: hypothetical protein KDK33_02535 [Leptospiraceae bacterium]|nr:hypothetical protein [Leptospiraceae bacterium]
MNRKITIIAGIILLILAIIIQLFSPKGMKLQEGFSTPIIAFEFVRTPEQVYSLFGLEIKPHQPVERCDEFPSRSQYWITAMDAINQLDAPFMLIYSGFIAFLAAFRFGKQKRRLLYAVLGLAATAFVFDLLENIALLSIADALKYCKNWSPIHNEPEQIRSWLQTLVIATHVKWAAIPLSFALMQWAEEPSGFRKWARRVNTALAVSALIAWVIAIPFPGIANEILGATVSLCFLLGFIEAVTPSRNARS